MSETKRIADALERIAKALEGGTRPVSIGGKASNTGSSGPTLPNYGRSKGQPIADASIDDLYWYGERCLASINDPDKARWRDAETARLDAINTELARRGVAVIDDSDEGDDFGPPPTYDDRPGPSGYGGGSAGPRDEEIPF